MKNVNVKIGLEVHVQLTSLKTKLFCSCPSDYRGKPPNTHVCPVCLGLPGSLPVVNEKAIEYAVMVAYALKSKVNRRVMFFRKHYFYPDMTKNFQITQYDRAGGAPIAIGGFLTIEANGVRKKVRIRRINIEEDPGKLVYPTGSIITSPYTLVDYNRAGIALLEIVTEPDMKSPIEARVFLNTLRSILEHLGVCDCSLEGSMRTDANISIGDGARVEIKNIGSPKDVEKALSYEIIRQKQALLKGVKVRSETRHWDDIRKVTVPLRVKEEEQDYRYFPEADIPPLILSEKYLEEIRLKMPELPEARARRFIEQYNLPQYDAHVLVSEKKLADFFESTLKHYSKDPKKVANLIINDFLRWLHEHNIEISEVKTKPKDIAELLSLHDKNLISIKIVKLILPEMIITGKKPSEIVREKKLLKISDKKVLEKIVLEVFSENRKAVMDALVNEKAMNYLIGQVMRKTRGKADPILTNTIVREYLEKIRKGELKF